MQCGDAGRFFEKKLGKKLPAKKSYVDIDGVTILYGFRIIIILYSITAQQAYATHKALYLIFRKLFAELFLEKATRIPASPASPASPHPLRFAAVDTVHKINTQKTLNFLYKNIAIFIK